MKISLKYYVVICLLISIYLKAQVNTDSIKIKQFNLKALEFSQTNFNESINYVDSALKINNKHAPSIYLQKQKANSYNILCNVYRQKGLFDKSVEAAFKALDVFNTLKDDQNKSAVLNNIANIYKDNLDLKTSLKYYYENLKVDQRLYLQSKHGVDLKESLIGTYINIASNYYDLNSNDSSMHYCNKALSLCDTTQISENLALIYNTIGSTHKNLFKYAIAATYHYKSLHIYEQLQYPDGVSYSYLLLAEINLFQNNYNKALEYATNAEQIDVENDIENDLLNAFEFKAKAYNGLKLFEKETECLKKYIALKDTIISQNQNNVIETLKTEYETEKKDAQIQLLNFENDKEKTFKYWIVAILTIITFFLIIVIYLLIKKQKANILLQQKNSEIKQQAQKLLKQEVELSKYQSQMNPHFISNALNGIQGLILNKDADKAFKQTQQLSKILRTTLNNSEQDLITLTEELSYNQQYIAFELNRFVNPFTYSVTTTNLKNNEDDILIPPMILQPILENSIKHAGLNTIDGAEISVTINELDNEKLLQLIIIDNGVGVNLEALNNSNSKSLKITRHRIKSLLGKYNVIKQPYFEIKKNSPTGTKIILYLPLLYK